MTEASAVSPKGNHAVNSVWLDTSDLKNSLAAKGMQGGRYAAVEQLLTFIITIANTVLLARLLSPADFGLLAAVTSVSGIATVFRDFGLSSVVIQKEDLTQEAASSLFWMSTGTSVLIALIALAMSYPVSLFYHDARQAWIMAALAPTFLINGLASHHFSLLRRRMHFAFITRLNVVGLVVNTAVSAVGAVLGLTYWSLVIGMLAQATVQTTMVWISCTWRPGRFQRGTGARRMVTTGGDVATFNLVNYLTRNADNILLMKFRGAIETGLYLKAYQLMMFPLRRFTYPLNDIMLPVFSRVSDDPIRFASGYRRVINVLGLTGMGLAAFSFWSAEPIIQSFLGAKWVGATAPFRWLAVAGFIQVPTATFGVVMSAVGRTREMRGFGFISSAVILATFLLTAPHGMTVLSMAYAAQYVIILPAAFYYLSRYTHLVLKDLLSTLILPVVAALAQGVSIAFASRIPVENSILRLLLDALAAMIALLAVYSAVPQGRQCLSELKSFASRRTSSQT